MAGDCELIDHGVNTNCDGLNKIGGINRRIFIGQLSQIDSNTLTFGSNGEVTAFALNAGETLKLFVSETFKQAGRNEMTKGDNGVVAWNHYVDLVHYWFSQRDVKSIENLNKARRLFAILEQNNGQFVVYGLGNTTAGYDSFGLSGETNTGTTGVLLTDDNTDKTTLSGMVLNKPMLYKPTQDAATNKTELEGMSLIES